MTAGDNGVSAVFSYAHSKGFFVGIALHACVILARPDCNEKFYGERHEVATVLSGQVERPVGAEPLYKALDEVLRGERPFYEHGGGREEWAQANGAFLDPRDAQERMYAAGWEPRVMCFSPFSRERLFLVISLSSLQEVSRTLKRAFPLDISSGTRKLISRLEVSRREWTLSL